MQAIFQLAESIATNHPSPLITLLGEAGKWRPGALCSDVHKSLRALGFGEGLCKRLEFLRLSRASAHFPRTFPTLALRDSLRKSAG